MKKLGKFFAAIWADWLTRMSGSLSVPFTCAALFLDSKYARTSFATLAIVAALTTAFRVWAKEYDRAETETKKNEATPHMGINILNVVPYSKTGEGLTDLFFNVHLILADPREVFVRDFSLEIFNEARSVKFTAMDDITEWDLVKPAGKFSRFACTPLVKTLTTRGDPVQGWVHFNVGDLKQSAVVACTLRFKVNGTHGTCYTDVVGGYTMPDADLKGIMMKRPKLTELVPSVGVPLT